MRSELKILLLEDDATDAELIAHELEASGFAFRLARIHAENELRREMETETPDLILSDHGLPSFSGFKALEIVREKHPQLPFIFVSGSNDQGMVAQMYEAGATDYVFKRDIGDLKTAVRQALELPTGAPPPVEHELELNALPASTTQPTAGRMLFCPQCRRSWDETGKPIEMENYCGTHAEIVVIRQLCPGCDSPRGSG